MSDNALEVALWGEDGTAILEASGTLDAKTYPAMRDVLLMTVLAQPKAVIVDLRGLKVDPWTAASVFRSVHAQVSEWPGVPIVLVDRADQDSWPLRHYNTVDAALADLGEVPARRVVRLPLPEAADPAFARFAAEETCLVWGIADSSLVVPVAVGLVDLVARMPGSRPVLGFELRAGLLAVVVTSDLSIRCEPHELRRVVSAARNAEPRCGWSTTWTGGTVVWAVVRPGRPS
ncbi:hypothetical protein [Actinosynnema sp. NPDC020468]|uniref:STAS domain-containing protein n=1 Tax=Actinosynnema sp. NPDC020468 TaxID=3154488 RepID=UPI0034030910